jgi:hypothetical protein
MLPKYWTSDAEEQGDVRSQVIQLLTAASYYLLPDLHRAVLALAQKLVSPSTALRWLQAAHVAGEAALEKAVLQYTLSNMDGGCCQIRRVAGFQTGAIAESWIAQS